MSIRSFIRGEFRKFSGKDLFPDWEAIMLTVRNRQRGIFGEPEKPAITTDARCGIDPDDDYIYDSYTRDILWSAESWSEEAVLESLIEAEERRASAKLALQKAYASMNRLDREHYGSRRGHRKGLKPRYKDHRLQVN